MGLDPEARGHSTGLRIGVVGGGDLVVESPVRVRDINLDGNIGAPVTARWIITFDLARQRVWIQPTRGGM